MKNEIVIERSIYRSFPEFPTVKSIMPIPETQTKVIACAQEPFRFGKLSLSQKNIN